MDRGKVKFYVSKLADAIIKELESYGLDFDLDEPVIKYNGLYAALSLSGRELPEGVNDSDRETFINLLKEVSTNFIGENNKSFKFSHCDCIIEEDRDYKYVIILTVSLEDISYGLI